MKSSWVQVWAYCFYDVVVTLEIYKVFTEIQNDDVLSLPLFKHSVIQALIVDLSYSTGFAPLVLIH